VLLYPASMFQAIDLEAPLEQPYRETFPGAARCQVTELTPCEAAPLQALGFATKIWSAGCRSFPLPERMNQESDPDQEHEKRQELSSGERAG
jgi:hypothetical protein